MPTDHACQAAAEAAAEGIAPVRALLAPVRRVPASRDEALPVVLRQYYGVPDGDEDGRSAAQAADTAPEPVSTAMGGAVLLVFLDGLRTELTGSLLDWYGGLPVRVPHSMGAPAAAAPELEPPREAGEWQALTELKQRGQELLAVIADHRRNGRMNELSWRLALVEDVFAGSLRRLDVPADLSVRCAARVADAAGSLFGIQHEMAR